MSIIESAYDLPGCEAPHIFINIKTLPYLCNSESTLSGQVNRGISIGWIGWKDKPPDMASVQVCQERSDRVSCPKKAQIVTQHNMNVLNSFPIKTRDFGQVTLTDREKDVSAGTPDGLFQSKFMPFSMQDSSETFQRLMNKVNADVLDCVVCVHE